jgi:hypothetical protein
MLYMDVIAVVLVGLLKPAVTAMVHDVACGVATRLILPARHSVHVLLAAS